VPNEPRSVSGASRQISRQRESKPPAQITSPAHHRPPQEHPPSKEQVLFLIDASPAMLDPCEVDEAEDQDKASTPPSAWVQARTSMPCTHSTHSASTTHALHFCPLADGPGLHSLPACLCRCQLSVCLLASFAAAGLCGA
jgi:hypothetical protein